MGILISELATYLQTAGVGTIGTDLFSSYMPDTVDTGVGILDTGGIPPDPDIPTKSPTFQIFIRSADYATGKALVDLVRATLHQLTNTTIGTTYVYYILAQSEGGHIGRNDRGLDEFSMNFKALTR